MNRYILAFLASTVFSVTIIGCREDSVSEPHKTGPPAKVENAVKETDLTSVRLSPKAEERLGIETAVVESRQLHRTRTLGGDIVIPPGQQITVSAPLAGTLTTPEAGQTPRPGSKVTGGQVVLRLLPAFLSDREVLQPSDRISLELARADLSTTVAEAEGEMAAAEVQVEAAKTRMDRAEKLYKENVGSVRAFEEAEAELRMAEARAEAGRERLNTLKSIHLEAESGVLTSLAIRSPQDGILQRAYAVPGEAVAAGAPLFEVTGIDPLWVRVPVYVGDVDSIDRQAPVRITGLIAKSESSVRSGQPVTAPPSADKDAATVDLFYQVDNPQVDLLPGQRVGAVVSLKATEESLVVPRSAILYDIHGGTWVYENTEPNVFVRRRVELRHVVDQLAVLNRGPAVGKKVVISGAAELFGTEFGGSK